MIEQVTDYLLTADALGVRVQIDQGAELPEVFGRLLAAMDASGYRHMADMWAAEMGVSA